MLETKCICTGGFVRGHEWDCPAGEGTIRENQIGGWNKIEIRRNEMNEWVEPDGLDRTTKSLIIGWILLLFGISQLVGGILSIVVLGISPTAIFLGILGSVAGAIGFTSVMIGSIRSK